MNCSLPTMPSLETPRRWLSASTSATNLYSTSLFGRTCTSGWSGCAAACTSLACSTSRVGSASPFHRIVPSKSMSIVTTTGSLVGGGGLPAGMFRFTECSWIGIVMISMISSTSITSISGVVLMSTITSGSAPPPPTLIAICLAPSTLGRRFGDEADLQDRRALAGKDHPPDALVAALLVAADVHLGLRIHHRHLLQALEQRLVVGHELLAPVDVAILVHREIDVLRLGLP